MAAAWIAAIAAGIYTLLTGGMLWVLNRQLQALNAQLGHMQRANTFDTVLAVLRELHAEGAHNARQYMQYDLPACEGLKEPEIQEHLAAMRPAVMAFHTTGLLMKAGELGPELRDEIMDFIWVTVWRCWHRSHQFIEHETERRRDPTYMERFKYLYDLADAHRIKRNCPEPIVDLRLCPESQVIAPQVPGQPLRRPNSNSH